MPTGRRFASSRGLTGPRSNLAALLDRATELEQQRIEMLIQRRRIGGPAVCAEPDGQGRVEAQRRNAEVKTLREQELKLLERDVALVPDNGRCSIAMGCRCICTGKGKRHAQALEKACQLEPDNDQFLFALALFYQDQGLYEQALNRIDQALQLRPDDEQYQQVRDGIGRQLAEQGQTNQ